MILFDDISFMIATCYRPEFCFKGLTNFFKGSSELAVCVYYYHCYHAKCNTTYSINNSDSDFVLVTVVKDNIMNCVKSHIALSR